MVSKGQIRCTCTCQLIITNTFCLFFSINFLSFHCSISEMVYLYLDLLVQQIWVLFERNVGFGVKSMEIGTQQAECIWIKYSYSTKPFFFFLRNGNYSQKSKIAAIGFDEKLKFVYICLFLTYHREVSVYSYVLIPTEINQIQKEKSYDDSKCVKLRYKLRLLQFFSRFFFTFQHANIK